MVHFLLTKTQILFFLQSMPMFSCLTHKELFKIVQTSSTMQAEKGKYIFFRGDPSDTMYIIYSGLINEYAYGPGNVEMLVKERRSMDFFGEMGMLNGKPHLITAIAAEDSMLITLKKSIFLSSVRDHAEITQYLLKVYSHRLQEAAERQIAHVYLDAAARLAYQILKMEKEVSGGKINISQEELALRCGMVRQTVAKLLTKWKKLGWLNTNRGIIDKINREALEQLLTISSEADALK